MSQEIRRNHLTSLLKQSGKIYMEIQDIVKEINALPIGHSSILQAKLEYDHKLSVLDAYGRRIQKMRAKINDNS